MKSHPPSEMLRRFVRGEADVEDARTVLPHVLAGCAVCRSALQAALLPPQLREYGPGIRRAIKKVATRLRRQKQRSEGAVGALQMAVGQEIAERVRGLAGPALVQAMLEESNFLLADDPLLASRVAQVACLAAASMSEELYGRALVHDWEALARAEYGNALRAADKLAAARIAFAEAMLVLPHGTGDKAIEARVYALLASFYGTQRHFVQAEGASDHAIGLYLRLGDLHAAGRELLTKATYLHYAGRTEEALAENERGLGFVEPAREPRLEALGRFNALHHLVTLGRFKEGEVALFKARPVLLTVFGRLDLVKLRWLEARIDAGLGRFGRAEDMLKEVRADLLGLEMDFAAALATLDLAHVLVEQEQWERAQEQAQDAEAMFQALGIGREMLAAVLVFVRSLEQRGQEGFGALFIRFTAQKAIAFIRRAENDPNARFGS